MILFVFLLGIVLYAFVFRPRKNPANRGIRTAHSFWLINDTEQKLEGTVDYPHPLCSTDHFSLDAGDAGRIYSKDCRVRFIIIKKIRQPGVGSALNTFIQLPFDNGIFREKTTAWVTITGTWTPGAVTGGYELNYYAE